MEKHMFCIHKTISSSLIISKKINLIMYTIQPRLQIYNNLLGFYDLSDKYKYSKVKFLSISHIKIGHLSLKLTNKNSTSILFQEFTTNQRFNFFSCKKLNFLKKFYITLRNFRLYYYFEFLINSAVLINKINKKKHISHNTINSILSVTMINIFLNFLNEKLLLKNNFIKTKIDFT